MRLSAGGHETELCRGFRAKRENFFWTINRTFSKPKILAAGLENTKKKKKKSIYSTFYTVVLFCDNFTLIFDASVVNLPSEARQIELTSIEN